MRTESPSQTRGGRATYLHDKALCEWFVHDRQGLEHGFTLAPPRLGATHSGTKLEFDLAVRGNLRPELSPDGVSLRFLDEKGETKLTYAELKVCDAEGRKLPARFIAQPQGVRLAVETTEAHYPITIDPLDQQAYLKTPDTEAEYLLGHSVAISGDSVIVGAPGEGRSATGLHGDQAPNRDPGSGAVHVFVRNGGIWSQQAHFKLTQPEAGNVFGFSVALSGNTLVLASYGDADNQG